MNRIYFFVSKGTSILSKIVKWYQFGNPWTHSGLVIELDDIRNPVVLSAVSPTKIGRFWDVHNKYLTKQSEFKYYYVEATDIQLEKYKKLVYDYSNKKYDIRGIISFLLRTKAQNPNAYFCSELVYHILEECGIPLFQNTKAYEVSSSMLIKSNLVKEDIELNSKIDKKYIL